MMPRKKSKTARGRDEIYLPPMRKPKGYRLQRLFKRRDVLGIRRILDYLLYGKERLIPSPSPEDSEDEEEDDEDDVDEEFKGINEDEPDDDEEDDDEDEILLIH
jgi:hypothetical protein